GGIYAAFGGTTVSFKDCTFSKNKAANGAGAFFGGGSVVTQVQINDCLFTQNVASNLGGGFRFDGLATGSVTGCTFTGNSAPRGAGTGFFQATVTLDDCVWDGNTAVASGGDPALGGGIYIEEGCDIDISNSIIRENSAPEAGGGIFLLAIEGQTNNLDLVACMIDRNATDDLGGGLYSQDPANIGIEETVFMANEAIEGGGIFLSDDGEVTITDARFESNSATWGGAILFNDISSSMTLSGSDFIQNSCSNQGGALYNFEGSPWTISDCLFQSNSAGDWGGAGYLLADQSSSMCTFERCRFVSNTSATSAGALYQNGGTFMVSNSVFFDNEASGDGIGNSISTNSDEGTGGPVLLLNNSFHEDAEGLGDVTPWAGSGEELDIRIQNCIFSGAGDSWKIEAGMIDQSSMGGNLLAGSAVDFPMDPTDLFDTDPLFVDASSGDLTLQSGSPAINSGVADGAPGTDLNGSARDDMPDRGAYEFGTTTSARDLVPLPGELVIKGNPVKNQLLAEWQGEILRDVSVAIVGSTGAVISLTRYDRLPNTLNLSIDHLPVGQYHLLLSTKMGIAGEAFVKM
nr:right-handed parallel beta-helix repeat-containing protein [Saprospiraceae bacterium]